MVGEHELLCPLCGDFLKRIDNDFVLRKHQDVKNAQEIEKLKGERKKDIADRLLDWFNYVVLVFFGGIPFIPLAYLFTDKALIIWIIALVLTILAGPIITMCIYLDYKKKMHK